jgi:predicted transcriptional regulator
MEAGFLRKSRRGGFEITRLGSLMLSRLEDLGFVNFNAGYFERHEVGVLPPGLDIISIMRQCDRNEDTMRTVNSILRIYAEARDWMCCMADEFSDAMVSVHAGKLDHGVGLRLITTAGRRVPSEYSEPAAGGVNARSMKRVPLFMSFSEREALLCLRLQGGGIDYSVSFSSADDAFVGWCATVFDHYWERARDLTL